MKFLAWYTLIMLIVGQLLNVATIGKPRKPLDGGTVAQGLVLAGPIIVYVALNLFR